MENTMPNEDYTKPEAQRKYGNTNLFFKEACEAMGLPEYEGKEVTRLLLRRIKQVITSHEGDHFVMMLPTGLREECDEISTKYRKEDVTAKGIKEEILNIVVDVKGAEPEKIAKNFWDFLKDRLGEAPYEGEGKDIMSQIRPDLQKLFTGRTIDSKESLSPMRRP